MDENSQQSKRMRAVAVVIKEDQVLLMFRIKNGRHYYTFPGGGVEAGETVEQAVLRELKEETSIEAKVEKLLYHHIYDEGSQQFFHLCSYLGGEVELGLGSVESKIMTPENYYEPAWIDIEILPKLLVYPLEIRDWLHQDVKNNFDGTPRQAKLKISDLRQSI